MYLLEVAEQALDAWDVTGLELGEVKINLLNFMHLYTLVECITKGNAIQYIEVNVFIKKIE